MAEKDERKEQDPTFYAFDDTRPIRVCDAARIVSMSIAILDKHSEPYENARRKLTRKEYGSLLTSTVTSLLANLYIHDRTQEEVEEFQAKMADSKYGDLKEAVKVELEDEIPPNRGNEA